MKQKDLLRFRNLTLAANMIAMQAEDQVFTLKNCHIGGFYGLDHDHSLSEIAANVLALQSDLIELYQSRAAEMIPTDNLSDTQRKILILRYMEGFKWKEIERALYIEERHLYRLHRAAIKNLESPAPA